MEYRVAGDIQLLKRLLARRYPVIVESVTSLDPNDALGPTDDLWAAHYLLLTGHDDAAQTFSIMDSYHESNRSISYQQLEEEWKPFNYVYMFFYLAQEEAEIKSILGADWDADFNRQQALEFSQSQTDANPKDTYAWFNLGSNLIYFDRNDEAALAFDQSREIGLPLRMFRYQFSPFIAYFQSNRIDDLLALTNYALGITEKSRRRGSGMATDFSEKETLMAHWLTGTKRSKYTQIIAMQNEPSMVTTQPPSSLRGRSCSLPEAISLCETEIASPPKSKSGGSQ